MGQRFGTGPWVGQTVLRPIVDLALAIVRWRYNVNLEQASPMDAVKRTQVPVFLIHGAIDGNIPLRHSRLLLAANPHIELWEVSGADHCGAISVAPAEFEQRVLSWFQTHNSGRAETHVRAVAAP
jgi:uncharacterized protein